MKFVKYVLCLAIFLSSISGVYAAEDSGVADALRQVKERIDTTEYDDFRSSYYKDDEGTVSYSFNWSKTGDSYAGLYVSFENGIITSYGKYDYDNETDSDAFSLGEAEAVGIAEKFIAKINPSISGKIKILPEEEQSIYSDDYYMNICITESGLPVLGETGHVSVSKATREVSDFYISYKSGIDFKTTDGIISAEAAKKAYKELAPLELRYKFRRDYDKKEISAYLEYVPKDGNFGIDAYDGSLYDIPYGGGRYYSKNAMEAATGEEAMDSGFTPAEYEETERIAGLLSENQVSEIIKKNEIIAMPEDFTLSYISLNRNWFNKNEYTYNVDFEKEEGNVSVNIDAKSGEILRFYKYLPSKNDEIKQDRKTEEEKANAAILALAGAKASEYRLIEDTESGSVSYIRVANGIDVYGDSVYFNFDGDDNIWGYYISYTKDVDFPSKEGVISKDDAAEKAFSAIGFELAYSIDYKEKTAKPIYYIGKDGETRGFTMNPFTGNLTDYNGEDLKEKEAITYSDIDEHYGRDIFNSLAKYGIGFSGGELKPDEPITQAEYFILLNEAFGYDADTDEIYKRMISYGTISAEERADNSNLTRENAAIFMIREIGAEEYAKYDEIFVAPFDDVTENKGYISILKVKGIINGDGSGNFYPQKTVTRGEALIMLYNYFTK